MKSFIDEVAVEGGREKCEEVGHTSKLPLNPYCGRVLLELVVLVFPDCRSTKEVGV